MERPDMCVDCGDGVINIRVGAIIIKDNKFLMTGNDRVNYLYSVGGRIKMGETAEEAVVREVYEETGRVMEIDHLGFVNENYFIGDQVGKEGRVFYELSFYFYMKTPADFEPVCESFTDAGNKEYLMWVDSETEKRIFPDFLRTEVLKENKELRYIKTDDRNRAEE